MKKIIILIIAVMAVSCSSKSDSVSLYSAEGVEENKYVATTPKFKEGDIVYLKPDSLKVVVTSVTTSVYKGQEKTIHTYYYYYHVTTIEDGTFRKSGRHNEIYFH